jgi:hypothetical protein
MSQPTLRRRLLEVIAASDHLRQNLRPDSPYAHVLRLGDIARYIGLAERTLKRCIYGKAPPAMPESMQRNLSRFFHGWDNGSLVKAKLADRWQILNPHSCNSPLAQVAAAPLPQANERKINMRIDLTSLGPRLRGG